MTFILQTAAALLILAGAGLEAQVHAVFPAEGQNQSVPYSHDPDHSAEEEGQAAQQQPDHPAAMESYSSDLAAPQPRWDPEPHAMVQANAAYAEERNVAMPRLYGVKTLLAGLLVASALLWWSVFSPEAKDLGRDRELFETDKKGLAGYADVAAKLGKHALQPFNHISQAEMQLYIGSIVFLLSGLYELGASIRKRRKARKGHPVPMHPPLRGAFLFPVGLLLGVIAIAGVLASLHMAFIGILHVAVAIVSSAALLLLMSLLGTFVR